VTHCARRLRLVIKGESGGISKSVQWNGGGGFDFYQMHHRISEDRSTREKSKLGPAKIHRNGTGR
jgi:hypothetical protein